MVFEFGCPKGIISEPHHPHEIIDLFPSIKSRIIKKCVPLYEKGYSLADVSKMTGVASSSIFNTMKKNRLKRRSRNEPRKTNPPFGYSWLSGKLVINPVEYKTVVLIRDLHESGMRPYQIEKYLNERKIPTRNGGKWFARIITNILKKEVMESKNVMSNINAFYDN